MRDGLEFLKDGLSFPIGGKVYTIPPVGIRTGIRLQHLGEGGEDKELASMDLDGSYRFVMGAAYDEMLADDVPTELVDRAFQSTMAYLNSHDLELAEQVWEAGSIPEFQAALKAAAQATLKTGSSTAAAIRTPSRASSSGTSSRRATKTVSRKANPSRGR